MLKLIIPGEEGFDGEKQKFVSTKPEVEVEFEHSLVSISKWESEFEIAFLGKAQKTDAHIMRYIELMVLTPLEDKTALNRLTSDQVIRLRDYITANNSATRLMEMPGKATGREVVTSELIYYWMTELQIPWEAQHWHINRLMTLIDLVQRKRNVGNKKMNKSDMAAQRAKLNAARRGGRPG